MICDEAIERLPWYLNGSLDPTERAEIHGHLADCVACRAALEETRLGYRIFSAHVPSEALVDYAWDRTPEGLDSGLIERHLEDCAECSAELELIRTSRRLAEEPDVVLLRPNVRAASGPAPMPMVVPRRALRTWQVSALAAALGGVVALSGWMNSETARRSLGAQVVSAEAQQAATQKEAERLRTESRELERRLAERPAAGGTESGAPASTAATAPGGAAEAVADFGSGNVLVEALSSDVARGGLEESVQPFSAKNDNLLLILDPALDEGESPADRYELEVRNAGGKVFSSSARFDKTQGGITFLLHPSKLGKGRYRVILSTNADGRSRKVGDYPFEVR